MPARSPDVLIRENIELVSLPAVVARINELLDDPTSSAADLAEYIGRDPALTARVLKIVNSALFNFPTKIDNLSIAVTVAGTKQLRDIVVASSVVGKFKNNINRQFDIETFWCHSITTGLASRTLGHELNAPNSERIFISGLLHDIGKMLIPMLLPNESKLLDNANRSPKADARKLEQDIIGFTHGDLAASLLRSWKFPESIYVPIQHHHDLASPDQFQADTAIVHIANVIANNIQAPVSPDDDTLLDTRALEILGIDESTIEPCYETVYALLDDVLNELYYAIAA